MSIQIKLKNSVVQDRTPGTSDLPAVGELALNANINSIGGFMRASDNSIVKIFGPGSVTTPTATTTVSGISELATNSETTTGTATNRVVTPAGLNAVTVAERATSNTNYVAKAGSTLTGVLTMPNGSNSAPAINFGDSDSGIFGGTNTVSLAAGGTTRLTADTGVDITGNLVVSGTITSTGAVTIPGKIFHAGDANTAFGFPIEDTVTVETGGSERARVDSTGRFLIGTSSARTNFFNLASTHTPRFQIESTNNDNGRAALGLIYGKTNASGPYIVMAKHRSNTVGDNTVVQSGDETGIIAFQGSDGTQFVDAARIQGFVDGTPGADDMPGRLVFSTTADGASTPTDRLTIDSAGTSTFAGNIATTGTLTLTSNSPRIILTESDADPDYEVMASTGEFKIKADGSGKIIIRNDGHIDLTDHVDISSGLDVTGNITSTGNLTISSNKPTIVLTEGDSNPDYQIFSQGGALKIKDSTNSADRLTVNTDGHVDIAGNLDVGAGIDVTGAITGTGDLTVDTNTLHVDSTNNRVGIGLTNPAVKLHISGTSGLYTRFQNTSAGNNVNFGQSAGDGVIDVGGSFALRILTNGSDRIKVDSSGRLLLGTTTEGNVNADDLTIATSGDTGITIRSGASSAGQIFFSDATSGNAEFAGFIQYLHNQNSLNFGTDETTRMTITNSGSVGIGTSSPTKPSSSNTNTKFMEISSADGADLILGNSATSVSAGDHVGALAFKNVDSNPDGGVPHYAGIRCEAANTSGSMDLRFYVGRGNLESDATNMIISAAGLVGIGTSSPACGLHIDNPNDAAITQILDTDNAAVKLVFRNNTETGNNMQIGADGSHLVALTGASERMRIDSAGRVGIGTTNIGSHQLLVQGGKAETGGSSLALKTGSGVSGINSDLALYGTFVSPTSDQGTRRTADIISGFAQANWGTEFLSFNVGKSGASNDTQQVCDERMRITGAGDLVLNSTTARTYNGHTPRFSVQGTNFSQSTVAITNNSTGNDGAYLFFTKQKSGSVGGSTAVSDNTIVGQCRYLAGDGTDVESEVANITVSIDGTPGSNDTPGRITFATTNDGGSVSTERMRITQSGQILMGTTSNNSVNAKLAVSADGVPSYYANPAGLSVNTTNSNDAHCVEFFQGRFNKRVLTQSHSNTGGVTFTVFEQADSNVGSITSDGSNCSYNGSSDYRLKENIVNLTDGITRLKQLIPRRFNWIADSTKTLIDGFIAHEVSPVLPQAVTGEKDALEEDGSIDPQQMDYAKLTPLLTAALQEAIAKIEILETKVAGLEAA